MARRLLTPVGMETEVPVFLSRNRLEGSLADTPLKSLLEPCRRHLVTGTVRVDSREGRGVLQLRAGIVDQASFGLLVGDAAVIRMSLLRDGSYTLEQRAPDLTGKLGPAASLESHVNDVPLAIVMRHCEDNALSCTLVVVSAYDRAELRYRAGDLVEVTLNGMPDSDAIVRVVKWNDARYKLQLDPLAPEIEGWPKVGREPTMPFKLERMLPPPAKPERMALGSGPVKTLKPPRATTAPTIAMPGPPPMTRPSTIPPTSRATQTTAAAPPPPPRPTPPARLSERAAPFMPPTGPKPFSPEALAMGASSLVQTSEALAAAEPAGPPPALFMPMVPTASGQRRLPPPPPPRKTPTFASTEPMGALPPPPPRERTARGTAPPPSPTAFVTAPPPAPTTLTSAPAPHPFTSAPAAPKPAPRTERERRLTPPVMFTVPPPPAAAFTPTASRPVPMPTTSRQVSMPTTSRQVPVGTAAVARPPAAPRRLDTSGSWAVPPLSVMTSDGPQLIAQPFVREVRRSRSWTFFIVLVLVFSAGGTALWWLTKTPVAGSVAMPAPAAAPASETSKLSPAAAPAAAGTPAGKAAPAHRSTGAAAAASAAAAAAAATTPTAAPATAGPGPSSSVQLPKTSPKTKKAALRGKRARRR